jgi:hypothetical protein
MGDGEDLQLFTAQSVDEEEREAIEEASSRPSHEGDRGALEGHVAARAHGDAARGASASRPAPTR